MMARLAVLPVGFDDLERIRRACIDEGLLDEDDLAGDLDDVRVFA